MAARRSKNEIRIDGEVDAAFRKHSDGHPINIFDISKVTAAGKEAGKAGENIEAAVLAAFEQYSGIVLAAEKQAVPV